MQGNVAGTSGGGAVYAYVSDGFVAVGATCFVNGWCPASNIAHERMRRVCAGFPADQVHLERVDTDDPQTRAEWGQVDGIFVDGHELRTEPPPTEAALRRQVERALRVRRWRRRLGLAV